MGSERLKYEILNAFNEKRPELEEMINCMRTENHYVLFPLEVNGVIDIIKYNTKTELFESIEYETGKGKGLVLGDVGLYPEIEKHILYLKYNAELDTYSF